MQPSYTHSRTSLRSLLILPLACLALLLLQSCGDDPVSTDKTPTDTTQTPTDTSKQDTTSTPKDTTVIPKLGSSFSFEQSEVDASGKTISDVEVTTLVVAAVDTALQGKTRVSLYDPDFTANYMAVNYEISGDLSVLAPGEISLHTGTDYLQSPTRWVIYPFATKKGLTTVVDFDTSGTIDSDEKSFKVLHTVEYAGSEDITIGSYTYTAQKAIDRIHRVDTDWRGDRIGDYTTTYWYVKQFGFFARIDEVRVDQSDTVRTQRVLKRFTLEK